MISPGARVLRRGLLLADKLGDVLLDVAPEDLFDLSRELRMGRRMTALVRVRPAQLEELPALDLQALDDQSVVPPALAVTEEAVDRGARC